VSIIADLNAQIAKLRLQIATIQSECSHPESTRKSTPGADTGNYDPSQDWYWIDHECLLCEKKWTEDKGNGRT
jgi:hypothetical protein